MVDQSYLRGAKRILEDALSNDPPEQTSNQSSTSDEDDDLLIWLPLIVTVICLLYIVFRPWISRRYCPRPSTQQSRVDPSETVLVYEGRVINLVGAQRRAVLEAIFSDSSKTAAEVDVVKKRKRKRKMTSAETDDGGLDQDDVPQDVEIRSPDRTLATEHTMSPSSSEDNAMKQGEPNISTELPVDDDDCLSVQSEDFLPVGVSHDDSHAANDNHNKKGASDDFHQTPVSSFETKNSNVCNSSNPTMSPIPKDTYNTQAYSPFVLQGDLTPIHVNNTDGGNTNPSFDDEEDEILPDSIALPDLPPSVAQARTASATAGFSIPENEECKETMQEEEDPTERLDEDLATELRTPIPLTTRESFPTVASEYTYDDDSTVSGDHVCPICLCGYKQGDTLIAAKHCPHMFHKECILEWLERHDDCPVCRTGMVSTDEMTQAAQSLVERTRNLQRAVTALQNSRARSAAVSSVRLQESVRQARARSNNNGRNTGRNNGRNSNNNNNDDDDDYNPFAFATR